LGNSSRNADEHFAYKLYEAVFLSLLLGTFVSMLSFGTEVELNMYMLIGSNVILLFPPIVAVAIYHTIHTRRFELTKTFEKWAYFAIMSLVLIAVSIFQEIIPIMGSLHDETLREFVGQYLEKAIVHPVFVMFLIFSFLWMYRKVYRLFLFPFVFFLLVFVPLEIYYRGKQLISALGQVEGIIIGILIVIVIFLFVYSYLLKD